MSPTKAFGAAALSAGFLAGAYVVVAQEDAVNWTWYAVAAGLMLAGVVANRTAARDAAASDDTHGASLDTLRASLEQTIGVVQAFTGIQDEVELTKLHGRIDRELVEPLGEFVEARESMIALFGMQAYADIMSAFANGERLINRTWSASADGYVDEVRTCLARALAEFESASRQLEAARA